MAMPVLFDEIAADLHLSLVQVGLVWGIGALPGIVAGLLGGAIGDRFGPKRVLILGCMLSGFWAAAGHGEQLRTR
jgi:MFS family permease